MIAGVAGLAVALSADVPVDPGAAEARRWIIAELSKPAYQAAKPTWFDLLSSAFWKWLTSLHFGDGGASWPLMLIAVVVVAAAVVVAFLIFGSPRLNRRSVLERTLFGEDDDRNADAMRASASAAAACGDWALAIEELFRAVARGLSERTIVVTNPGTTARDFAVRAGGYFPELATRFVVAAQHFDAVRYLGRSGSEEAYLALAELEKAVRSMRPVADALAGSRA
jgi:hypothetical protein